MAQRVVYLLEVVEIDVCNRERPTIAEASCPLFIKCFIKCTAVGNGSQWIDAGELLLFGQQTLQARFTLAKRLLYSLPRTQVTNCAPIAKNASEHTNYGKGGNRV